MSKFTFLVVASSAAAFFAGGGYTFVPRLQYQRQYLDQFRPADFPCAGTRGLRRDNHPHKIWRTLVLFGGGGARGPVESVKIITAGGKVLRKIISFICFLVLTFGTFTQAKAENRGLAGSWQQIASNAGKCDKCRITIEQQGSVLRVTSNNGWFAIVEADQRGKSNTLSGVGRWKPGYGGSYSRASFDIHFTLTDGQLYMNMTVPMKKRPTQVIKAIFDKLPSGNRDDRSTIKA
ncbi:hypothetical protein GOD53_29115 [Sinorhizobium medicae]|nr:hypothetical protein [Sinorhizobium medicae]MDX0747644.1 hypothetical protein [Sinorhizobium medicae]